MIRAQCWLVTALFAFAWMVSSAVADELGGDFQLTDHHGEPFNLSDYRGSAVLLAFGFTHCPDVCPLELATIAQTLKQVPADKVKALFITLDPERDSVEQLSQFVPFFHERIVGLTGSVGEIKAVAAQYGIRYSHHGDGQDYTIDHSSGVHVLDADGTLQSVAPFGAPASHLLKIVNALVQPTG